MKAFVLAYFSQNFGDDMFIRMLVRRYPNVHFYLWGCDKFMSCVKNEANVSFPKRRLYYLDLYVGHLLKNRLGLLGLFKAVFSNCIIRIGGSIFIEYPGRKYKTLRIHRKTTFIIGANYGPVYSQEFRNNVIRDIQSVADCCFRDSMSYNNFRNLSNVHYAPDVLFGYPYSNMSVLSEDCIGISVIDLANHTRISHLKEQYINMIVDFCNVCTEKNIKVKLFSFCSNEGDKRAIDDIISQALRKDLLITIEYSGDLDYFLDQINSCGSIVATRFHAMIVGWCLGKRVVPIIYSEKQTNVLRDVQCENATIDLLQNEIVDGKTLFCLSRDNKIVNVKNYKGLSEEQFSAFDRYARSRKSFIP